MRVLQDECEEKLAVAMPAMRAAIAALDTLKQNDIAIVKSMSNPPSGVKLVLEAVCILKVTTNLAQYRHVLSVRCSGLSLSIRCNWDSIISVNYDGTMFQ